MSEGATDCPDRSASASISQLTLCPAAPGPRAEVRHHLCDWCSWSGARGAGKLTGLQEGPCVPALHHGGLPQCPDFEPQNATQGRHMGQKQP